MLLENRFGRVGGVIANQGKKSSSALDDVTKGPEMGFVVFQSTFYEGWRKVN